MGVLIVQGKLMSQQERVKVKHDDESSVSKDESMGKNFSKKEDG